MSRLKLNISEISGNAAYFQDMEETCIAIESVVEDVEFREVKNDDKGDKGEKKSFIMEKIKGIIAWFREKIKKIGDFIKNLYYKNRYMFSNKLKSVSDLAAEARDITYKHLVDEGDTVLAEKIKRVSNNDYIQFVLTDMSSTLAGKNRLSEFKSFGRLVDILKASSKDIKKCWSEVKSNNQDVSRYLDNIEKQNDEFERVSNESEATNITSRIFTKMLDDMREHRLTDIIETIGFCDALNKESDKVLSGYTGDVSRITSVMARYTVNYTKLIYCTDVQFHVCKIYFGSGASDEEMNRVVRNFISCYEEGK